MKPEIPAQGISKWRDFGFSQFFRVTCDCGCDDHKHMVEIEVDHDIISVNIYTKTKSKWWSTNRFKQIWQILTKGYIEEEVAVILTEQAALNYASTLEKAIKEVRKYKENENE